MRASSASLVAIAAFAADLGSGCGSNCDGSSVDQVGAQVTVARWSLIELVSHHALSTVGNDTTAWLGQTGEGDGLHFALDLGSATGSSTGAALDLPTEGTLHVHCGYIAEPTLAQPASHALATFCGHDGGYDAAIDVFHDGAWVTFDLSKVEGTARVDTTSDPASSGTTTITIDVP
ncbi:MAG: hypothetical protein ACHREM_16220, partial [Polyangiales bacterium]